MTTTELQNYLNQRLSQLSPDFLKMVAEFVDFLLHKQGVRIGAENANPEALGWSSGFFEETFGAWQGEPLEREMPGELVEREPIL